MDITNEQQDVMLNTVKDAKLGQYGDIKGKANPPYYLHNTSHSCYPQATQLEVRRAEMDIPNEQKDVMLHVVPVKDAKQGQYVDIKGKTNH